MGSTRVNGYPYPEDTGQPTVPADLRAAMELMAQGDVMRFANAADRTAAFAFLGTSPSPGMLSYLADVDRLFRYSGTTWVSQGYSASNSVATAQSTASAAYVDLGTVGPTVTIDTGTAAKVSLAAGIFNSGANATYMGFAVSGATTRAAADSETVQNAATTGTRTGITVYVTGLTPGVNVFTAKYRVVAGTGSYYDRNIIVEPVVP